jgi:uncharacterized protein YdaU (DUF1376 family)
MNFYPFHIGDYLTATRHLSWDEDLAYRRLIDLYYTREAPLPLDRKQVYRLVVAADSKQRTAVDAVISEFFTEAEDGFHNARCDEELTALASKRDKAKQSADARWKRNGAQRSHSDGNANASDPHMRTHSEGNATNTNTNTNTNKDDGIGLARARDPIPDLETKLREAAGWQNEPAPNLAVTGQIEALIANGCDLDLDVLPIIRAFAPRVRSRTNWKYFIGPIQQSRDDRIAASSPVNTEIPNVSRRMNGNGSHQTTAGRNPKPSAAQEMRDALADLDGSGTITGF